MVSIDDDYMEEATVLPIESLRLITEDVICQGIKIRAVVSVASPNLQDKLKGHRMEWYGQSVVMVNDQRAPPLVALDLKI